jgi:hypothetical protein
MKSRVEGRRGSEPRAGVCPRGQFSEVAKPRRQSNRENVCTEVVLRIGPIFLLTPAFKLGVSAEVYIQRKSDFEERA